MGASYPISSSASRNSHLVSISINRYTYFINNKERLRAMPNNLISGISKAMIHNELLNLSCAICNSLLINKNKNGFLF